MKHCPGTSKRTKAGLVAGYGHLSVLHLFVGSQDEGRPVCQVIQKGAD